MLARIVTAGMFLQATLGGGAASAQAVPLTSVQSPAVLDVPYLSQSILLCGGAAIAMVERWWGRRGVYAEDFSALVHADLGGIRTTDLAAAARGRGWDTRVFDGTAALVRSSLAEGVPVIALIEVAPARYHYVVVLAWREGRVTFHDPARAPARAMDERRFLTQWAGGERWMMVLRPSPAAATAPTAGSLLPTLIDSLPCRPWIDRALDAVAANRLDDAAALLAEGRTTCPMEAVVLRELAGVRFKQGRHAEAAELAVAYLSRAPDDPLGWQLLATSRYLSGDRDGALAAWNRLGRPTIDLIRIDGLRDVRFREIAGAMPVSHGAVLTSSGLALARRQVADLPALRGSAVDYRPMSGGLVEVRAVVAERPMVGRVPQLLAAGMIGAVAQNEVRFEVATPTGAGELWSAMWRWERARPRAAIRLDIPERFGVRGVLAIEGARERYRFALDTARSGISDESRRTAFVGFGGWVTSSIRPSAGLRLERWSGGRDYLAAVAGTELHTAGDRLGLTMRAEYGLTLRAAPSYARGGATASWVSAPGLGHGVWSARLGLDLASRQVPLGLWPTAGGNLSWAIPLRAHPTAADGALAGWSAGRAMAHGGLTADHPIGRFGLFVLAGGVFLDAARVAEAADGVARNRLYLDAGAGLRIGIADGRLGVIRIDVARGLADHSSAVTVGIHRRWPPFGETER